MDAKIISLKTIDWNLSLKLANNREDLAMELLALLMAELPQAQRSINEAYQTQNQETLHHYIHKLHGASCYCGVPRLKEIAALLETKIKNNNEKNLENLLNILNHEIEQLKLAFKKNEYRS